MKAVHFQRSRRHCSSQNHREGSGINAGKTVVTSDLIRPSLASGSVMETRGAFGAQISAIDRTGFREVGLFHQAKECRTE